MAAITPSYTIVNPSYIAPEMIIGYQQASGAFETIASGNPQVRLGVGDQYVYMRRPTFAPRPLPASPETVTSCRAWRWMRR